MKIKKNEVVLSEIDRSHIITYLWRNNLWFFDDLTLKLQWTLEKVSTYQIKDDQVVIPYSDGIGSFDIPMSKVEKMI